ncbi:hypothetical protein MPRS_18490 [Mycobacterium paraseoulense]|nr:hypothetical protein MPRS_18490 [Mycobacterium paraseoulense]
MQWVCRSRAIIPTAVCRKPWANSWSLSRTVPLSPGEICAQSLIVDLAVRMVSRADQYDSGLPNCAGSLREDRWHDLDFPFHIEIPDTDLVDLKERLARARWPGAECVDDWSRQGVQLSYVRQLAAYWARL